MGLRRLKDSEVTPAISRNAKEIRDAHWKKPVGSCFPFEADGRSYVGIIEEHFHPVGGPVKPWGKHHGVSVFEKTNEVVYPTNLSGFHYSKVSLARLKTVDPRLQRLFLEVIKVTPIDVSIVCGKRSLEEQAAAVRSGASSTMNSRHLTGHAVDVAPFVGGGISWDWKYFDLLAPVVKRVARDLLIPVEWGGDWPNNPPKSFRDGPHWQIPWGK